MNELMSATTFSDLVGAIYDCALDPPQWPTALSGLRRTLNFHSASLTLMLLPEGTVLLSFQDGLEEPWLSRMSLYGADVLEQWGGIEKLQSLPIDEPQVLSQVNPRGATDAIRYFREWARPQGLIDVMGLGLTRDATSLGSIGLGRHQDAGAITPQETAAARLLLPHLQRAIAISRLLEIRALNADTFAALFDKLAVAIVLVDGDRRIRHANAEARQMLAVGDLIRASTGRLTVCARGADQALAVAVAQAISNESAIGRRGFDVPIRRDGGSSHVLHVLPVSAGTLRSDVMPRTAAAVFIAPAPLSRPVSIDAIARLFGLTAAEAKVLERIAAGFTNAEIAQALGVGVSTVRTHLLHLFEKTGARRQAELVALVASFDLPVGH